MVWEQDSARLTLIRDMNTAAASGIGQIYGSWIDFYCPRDDGSNVNNIYGLVGCGFWEFVLLTDRKSIGIWSSELALWCYVIIIFISLFVYIAYICGSVMPTPEIINCARQKEYICNCKKTDKCR